MTTRVNPPGFGKLTDILYRKEQELLKNENNKAESSLNKINESEKSKTSEED